MIPNSDYELLDFGNGRKLERFGEHVLDRPSPSSDEFQKQIKSEWKKTDSQFLKRNDGNSSGDWKHPLEPWEIQFDSLRLELKQTPFGHVGLFPEHAMHWPWFESLPTLSGKKLLHLFAYTGATTLKLAQLGAQVVHVDASKSVVSWARKNAELADLSDKPVRWIVEDALRFVNREVKRGNQYDGFILDPPTYGHGPSGEVWKIEDSIRALMNGLSQLTRANPNVGLLTSHSAEFRASRLERMMNEYFKNCPYAIESGEMNLSSRSGQALNCGWFARIGSRN